MLFQVGVSVQSPKVPSTFRLLLPKWLEYCIRTHPGVCAVCKAPRNYLILFLQGESIHYPTEPYNAMTCQRYVLQSLGTEPRLFVVTKKDLGMRPGDVISVTNYFMLKKLARIHLSTVSFCLWSKRN